jgi:hypothetical protein
MPHAAPTWQPLASSSLLDCRPAGAVLDLESAHLSVPAAQEDHGNRPRTTHRQPRPTAETPITPEGGHRGPVPDRAQA